MTQEEYYFYEWLIIGKGYTEEMFNDLNDEEFKALYIEYNQFKNTLK